MYPAEDVESVDEGRDEEDVRDDECCEDVSLTLHIIVRFIGSIGSIGHTLLTFMNLERRGRRGRRERRRRGKWERREKRRRRGKWERRRRRRGGGGGERERAREGGGEEGEKGEGACDHMTLTAVGCVT